MGHKTRIEIDRLTIRVGIWNVSVRYFQQEKRVFADKIMDEIREVWKNTLAGTTQLLRADFTIEIHDDDDVIPVKREGGYDFFRMAIWDTKRKRVILGRHFNISGFNFTLRSVLYRLLGTKGFVLHGSSAVDPTGKLAIFSAYSGGGKSTTMQTLLQNKKFRQVSDDLLLFVAEKNKFVCYPTGLLEKNVLPQIGRYTHFQVYDLHKNKKFGITPIPKTTAKLKILMKQIWFENEDQSPEVIRKIFTFAENTSVSRLDMPLHYVQIGDYV